MLSFIRDRTSMSYFFLINGFSNPTGSDVFQASANGIFGGRMKGWLKRYWQTLLMTSTPFKFVLGDSQLYLWTNYDESIKVLLTKITDDFFIIGRYLWYTTNFWARKTTFWKKIPSSWMTKSSLRNATFFNTWAVLSDHLQSHMFLKLDMWMTLTGAKNKAVV